MEVAQESNHRVQSAASDAVNGDARAPKTGACSRCRCAPLYAQGTARTDPTSL